MLDGAEVGYIVSTSVGIKLGQSLGVELGTTLGKKLGKELGLYDESDDGDIDGNSVRMFEYDD